MYFGRVYVPDSRDFRIKKKRLSKRATRYWNDGEIFLNQGQTPECVGFSASHYLLNNPLNQYIDPHGLYTICKYLDQWSGEDYDGTSVRAGAKALKLLGFIGEYRWAFDLQSMVQTVLDVGPVMLGLNWYEGMFDTDTSGFISKRGKIAGGHAITCNGVSIPERKFRLKQSWGRDWGNNGRCYISFDDMESLLKENGECCLAIKTKPSWENYVGVSGLH